MSLTLRAILNVIGGLAIGFIAVFLTVLLSLAFVFMTGAAAGIPGIISIWPTEENDAIALNFEPNFLGMGIAMLVIAVVYAVIASAVGHRRAAHRTQTA